MEYGWNKVLPQATEDDGEEELEDMRSVRSGKSQKSLRSTRSGKSRFSSHASSFAHFGGHSSNNPNDRVIIAEWKPPQQPLTGSTLSEDEQLKALQRYARLLQSELETHNELRAPMSRLYSSRSPNASKSTANWEKRSSFLLSEIVKYTTYVSALEDAIKLRSQKTADKAMEKMLKSADEDDEQESLAAVTGRRGLMIHEKFAGSFADVTAPLAHCGDAPIDGIRAQRSSAASLGSFDTEYHETRSLSQSVSDQVSPRASEDISF